MNLAGYLGDPLDKLIPTGFAIWILMLCATNMTTAFFFLIGYLVAVGLTLRWVGWQGTGRAGGGQ